MRHFFKNLSGRLRYVMPIFGWLLYAGVAPAQEVYLKELDSASATKANLYIPVRPTDQANAACKAQIKDVLGDFETEEDLHLTIASVQLKYNIGAEKQAITLEFGSKVPGNYQYKIWGYFRHKNGQRYEFTGNGTITVQGGEFFDLYLLSIDHVSRTAIVYIN